MAQQSARRDRDNQAATPYLEYATVIWTRSANSHAGPRSMAAREAGQMAASDYASRRFLTFSLAQKGASTDVAWISRESSEIRQLRRIADFDFSCLFKGLAYPCNICGRPLLGKRKRQESP